MSMLTHFAREARFLARDRVCVFAIALLLLLSCLATISGLARVAAQEREISAMIAADAADRAEAQAPLTSFGDAAYYSFYVTWDAPEPLAFAALGQRDTAPFLKRIRMLALEGQIYQGESPNPLLAQIGALDLSFIAAYILPLVLIVLLHDLKARERAEGRLNLLEANASAFARLWLPRIALRSVLAWLALLLPLCIGAALQGAHVSDALSGAFGLLALTLFWAIAASAVASAAWRGSTIGAVLIGLWLALNVLLPAAVQSLVVPQVEGPEGADVALVQREAVNDAWDIPKEDTLAPFAQRLPQYAITDDLKPFDWRWYFAFQYMGDVAASDLSEQYRAAIRARDNIAAMTSWLSPALAIQRHLQALGHTGTAAQLAYDARIRDYHRALQAFYHPLVFGKGAFSLEALESFPKYQ